MARSVRKKPAPGPKAWDASKEKIYRELTAILEESGVSVRREELKRGHGWKVVSGACRVYEKPVVFVDRHMTPDDQILFLATKIAAYKPVLSAERLGALPEGVRRVISGEAEREEAVGA